MNSLREIESCTDALPTDSGCTIDPITIQDESDWFSFIGQNLAILWKDWPRDMEAVNLNNGGYSFKGTCPYPNCNRASVFIVLTSTGNGSCTVAVLQCQACQGYILGIVEIPPHTGRAVYSAHYPMGSPDETVAVEVPAHIREDFKEALRCLWVKAYNASAEMCRRAMEATCLDLGAPPDKVLEKMIDWLEVNRKITPYLKDAAHKVRLGGNRAAHPPATPITATPVPAVAIAPAAPALPNPIAAITPVEKIEKEHAEAIVEFCREFFHHVYVGPKLVGKYDFTKPKATPPPTK